MSDRVKTMLIQLGLLVVVLAVLPYKLFELDRYFVPKELALHVVAFALLLLMLTRARTIRYDAADALLVAFLVWSTLSTLFATNYWLAQRALGVSVSSALVFWASRRIGARGGHRPILIAAAAATVVAALTCLLQAYGLETDYFSLNRAPGGTFGNRNFVAHMCAIGLPALLYAALTARTSSGELLGYVGTGIVASALVLSRSRAAWLAVAASLGMLALPFFASRRHWRGFGVGARSVRLAATSLVCATLAMFLPNSLNWSSDSPYLDSARGVMDYSSGSGRGRVTQYLNSARMARSHPLFGVGPGNWPVEYVEFARPNDASLADDGMTANPWPSSDWVAFASERGVIAALALLGVFASLFVGAWRRWPEIGADGVLAKVALVGSITATLVVGMFDAALLLAAPAYLSWAILGAASGVGRVGRERTLSAGVAVGAQALTIAIVTLSVLRSAGQTAAIVAVGPGGTRAGWIAAAPLDPGSYRINARLAEFYSSRGRCETATIYARRARDLFPHARAPRRVLDRCETR
jgi:O-antigen ligase